MGEIKLIQAVEQFAAVTADLSTEDLEREWGWRAYHEGIRFAFFRTYEELRQLAARLLSERVQRGKPITTAQRSLGQYHAAYRDLQAVLLGVEDALLDQPPAHDEWPLRVILGHILAAEREFFARTWYAVQQHRQGIEEAREMPAEELVAFVGAHQDFERTIKRLSLNGILAYYDTLHKRVLREIADIRGSELDAPSLWWEGAPMSVEFRLHRLDSHLRQHTIQVQATLEALNGPFPEARRLLRLVYAALAEVEGVIIGDWLLGQRQQQEVAALIHQRAEEVAALLGR